MGFYPILGWANVDGVSIFHSSLLTQDADMNIVEDLADEYAVSNDGLAYTFRLREGAKFSDGSGIKSSDVAFTYREAAKGGQVGNLAVVRDVDTPDERTAIIHLKEPNSLFLYSVTRLGIVPEHAYSAGYGQNPIGSGPYKLSLWEQGKQLMAEENPLYYGARPALKKLTVLFCDEDTAFECARNGELDFYSVSRTYANENIPGMDLLHFKSADRLNISWPTQPSGVFNREDGLPVGNDVTADKAIRHAISVGIDREALVDEEIPWYNEKTAYTDNNISTAKVILQDGDGIVEKNGIKELVVNCKLNILPSITYDNAFSRKLFQNRFGNLPFWSKIKILGAAKSREILLQSKLFPVRLHIAVLAVTEKDQVMSCGA